MRTNQLRLAYKHEFKSGEHLDVEYSGLRSAMRRGPDRRMGISCSESGISGHSSVAVIFVPFPDLGIQILPVILVIDVVLAVKGTYPKRTFVVQAIVLVIAFCFCLQGLRQSPPPPPESGITVRGACKTVLLRLASIDGDRQLVATVAAHRKPTGTLPRSTIPQGPVGRAPLSRRICMRVS